MVEEPINYLEKLSDAGFKRFIGHVEKMTDQVQFVARGEELGAVGLGIDLPTSLSSITVSLEDLDQILLMSVNAGFSGQTFNSSVIEKIKELKGRGFTNIEIDGGINDETLQLAKTAGANMFCATSFLFKGEPKKQFELLSSL
jgi:ribulose-phosphate 3-epimerase